MKKLLLLFTVLLSAVGAWAQEVVTYINVNNVYKLHCNASIHASGTPQGKYLADDADGNILGRSDEGTYFCFEKADGENLYYIKNVKTGKYINAEASSNAPVTTSTDKANATVWTLGVPAHTTGVVTFGLPGDFYLNNNGGEGSQYLKANYHNGGPAANNACSLWKLEDHGTLVTFVNVQKNGTQYALYINNGALDKTKLTGETTIESLGDNAKFVATKLANGKYTFYNVANKVYMIWRGKSGGHNGDKGVLETYNSEYCDWEIVSSHGDGREGTMSLYGKRGNNSNGSLILLNNGTFDAYGYSLGWADGYSNVFQIDNLAHFTYTFKYKDETKGAQESIIAPLGNVYPAPKTLPAYVTCSLPEGIVGESAKEQTYDIAVEYDLPFDVSEDFASAKWYHMNIRSNKWVTHSETLPYGQNNYELLASYAGQWAFMGNPFDGIQILNKSVGEGYTLGYDGTSTGNNIHMKTGTTSWTIEKGNGGFALHIGTTNQYLHDYNSKLQIWNAEGAKTDNGSALNVNPVEEYGFFQCWGNHYPWTTEVVTDIPDDLSVCQYSTEGHDHTIKMAETSIIAKGGEIKATFTYTSGAHMLMIAGVDLVKDGSVVKHDYHEGKSGGQLQDNIYTLTGVEAGEYTLRYFVCEKKGGDNSHDLTATNGLIAVDGAKRSDLNVTYNYVFEGQTKHTQTMVCPVGSNYPEKDDYSYDYITVGSKPAGTILDRDIVNGVVTKEITLSENLPFVKSVDYASAKWYIVDMHSNDTGTGDILNGSKKYVWTYVAEGTPNVQLPKETSKQVALFGEEKLWCFVGDVYNGFKIFNKAAGDALTLNKVEVGNGAPANMSASSSAILYKLVPATGISGATCFLPLNNNNGGADDHYLNTQAVDGVKVLKGWTDSDGGSSCRFFAPTDFVEESILAEYDANIPACAVGTKSELTKARYSVLGTALQAIQANAWDTEAITTEVTEALDVLQASNDKVEMSAGYYFIKGTGTGNDANWYVTYDGANCKAIDLGNGEKLSAKHVWSIEAVDGEEGKYKFKSSNLNKYLTVAAAPAVSEITSDFNQGYSFTFTEDGLAKWIIKDANNNTMRTEREGGINEWHGGEDDESWYIIPATELDITISNAGWATTCLPFDVVLPEELTAYALTGVDNLNGEETGSVSLISKAGIKANEGALLNGAPGTYTLSIEETASNWEANMLSGTTVAKDMSTLTGDVYLLTADGENSAKLSKLVLAGDATEAKKTLAANKAYLNIATSSARFLVFNFDEDNETAIESIGSEDGNMKEEIFDLAGRRVQKAQKGLYIVNGKKVIK